MIATSKFHSRVVPSGLPLASVRSVTPVDGGRTPGPHQAEPMRFCAGLFGYLSFGTEYGPAHLGVVDGFGACFV